MSAIATPRRYMAFINTYQSVYSNKKAKIEQRQHHLQVYLRVVQQNLYIKTILGTKKSGPYYYTQVVFISPYVTPHQKKTKKP